MGCHKNAQPVPKNTKLLPPTHIHWNTYARGPYKHTHTHTHTHLSWRTLFLIPNHLINNSTHMNMHMLTTPTPTCPEGPWSSSQNAMWLFPAQYIDRQSVISIQKCMYIDRQSVHRQTISDQHTEMYVKFFKNEPYVLYVFVCACAFCITHTHTHIHTHTHHARGETHTCMHTWMVVQEGTERTVCIHVCMRMSYTSTHTMHAGTHTCTWIIIQEQAFALHVWLCMHVCIFVPYLPCNFFSCIEHW